MKKLTYCGVVLASLLLLAGCTKENGQSSGHETSASKASQGVKVKVKKKTTATGETTSSEEVRSLWSADKKTLLHTFMVRWGNSMKQTYREYDETRSSDYAGLHFPAELANYEIAVDDQTVAVNWSADGQGAGDYQVVAVYCDVEGDSVGGHLYLFSLHNGEPVVLYTSQNQGMPDGRLHFSATENAELAAGFAEIVQQTDAQAQTTVKAAEAAATMPDSKLLAAKVGLKRFVEPNLKDQSLDAKVDEMINIPYDRFSITVRSEEHYEIWTTGVYLPESITGISWGAYAAGSIMYHNNGDGSVRIYPVPTHYQDHDWDDPVIGKKWSEEIIQQAYDQYVDDIPDATAQRLADFMTGEVTP